MVDFQDEQEGNDFLVINDGDLPPEPVDASKPDFTIEERELEKLDSSSFFPSIIITADDILKVDNQILRIGLEDLPEIIQITYKDLPKIIKIGLQDLPPDLTGATTECYHGTSHEAAKNISQQGFRVGNGTGYGAGIYFSVGGMSIARGYLKGTPCIIHARVAWGNVAYLDDPKVIQKLGGTSGPGATDRALSLGYNSFLTSSKYSQQTPAVGVVLGRIGTYIRPPQIEVVELIDPRASTKP